MQTGGSGPVELLLLQKRESEANLRLMQLLDEQCTRTPFYHLIELNSCPYSAVNQLSF